MKLQPGTWLIIRTNGAEELRKSKPTIPDVSKAIGADCLDTVNLRDGSIMMVDDAGAMGPKTQNCKATALYHAICRPGTTWSIFGDVAIVLDSDFA